jgi:hypothetical protein
LWNRSGTQRPERLRRLVETAGEYHPTVGGGEPARAGHDDLLAAENLVHLDGALDLVGHDVARVVVRADTADAHIIHQLAEFLGLLRRVIPVQRVVFHRLVADLGDLATVFMTSAFTSSRTENSSSPIGTFFLAAEAPPTPVRRLLRRVTSENERLDSLRDSVSLMKPSILSLG